MKNIFLFLLIIIYSFAFSQSESDILYIRTQVETINTQSKNYNTFILKKDKTESTEDSEILVITEELDKIRLIKETYFGEMGKTIIWNYIDNNHPVFVFKEYFTYKLPIVDKNFNSKDFMKKEERFYFKDSRIIRWMIDKKILKKYPSNAATIENNVNESISGLIAQFNKETKE